MIGQCRAGRVAREQQRAQVTVVLSHCGTITGSSLALPGFCLAASRCRPDAAQMRCFLCPCALRTCSIQLTFAGAGGVLRDGEKAAGRASGVNLLFMCCAYIVATTALA
jgi:hypothetical protein